MLQNELKRIDEFFAQDNLAQTTIRYEVTPAHAALVVIDVQREFCDPLRRRGTRKTDEVSKKIGTLLPAFRAASLPVYMVYSAQQEQRRKSIDFYNVKTAKSDTIVRKQTDSAFQSGTFKTQMFNSSNTHLLVCGFNASACVMQSVLDGIRRGYSVDVISDLTGNDRLNCENVGAALERMKAKGARIVHSDDVFKALQPMQMVA